MNRHGLSFELLNEDLSKFQPCEVGIDVFASTLVRRCWLYIHTWYLPR